MAGKNLTESLTFMTFLQNTNCTTQSRRLLENFLLLKNEFIIRQNGLLEQMFNFEDKLLICKASIRPQN